MKLLLITTLVLTFGLVTYAQTDSTPAAKTDCKEQPANKKTKKVKGKAAHGEAQASAATAEVPACPSTPDPAPDATPAVTAPAPAPTPTAALRSAAVAPPVDNRQLNVTIYQNPEESLGAAARRIRTRKAMEEANKPQ